MAKVGPKAVECRGVSRKTGKKCTRATKDSSGLCKLHRDKPNDDMEFVLLVCKDCQIQDCDHKGELESGLCYFEIADQVKDFDTRWKVQTAMRETLMVERLTLGRLSRIVSQTDLNKIGTKGSNARALLKDFKDLSNQHVYHLDRFGNFMGYKADKSEDETQKDKDKTLTTVFKREKKKDEKLEAHEKEIKELCSK